jgi:hypothetical protein
MSLLKRPWWNKFCVMSIMPLMAAFGKEIAHVSRVGFVQEIVQHY